MDGKYIQQFKKGSMEMVLLCLIAQKETYGYEILSALNRYGGDMFGSAKEGTVYPILYRLQNTGLIQCRFAPSKANGSMKKYYSLTPTGEQTLRELVDYWDRYVDCVNGFRNLWIEKGKEEEDPR